MKIKLVGLFSCIIGMGCAAQETAVWTNYKNAAKSHTEPILPNFSYAGYKFSEIGIPEEKHRVFNVQDFGARADDGISDKQAVVEAIKAAEANGSGIVYFPAGRYHFNTPADDLDPIQIRSSNIIFRGPKKTSEKAVLFFERDIPPTVPEKIWTSPYAIQTKASEKSRFITDIKGNATRETHTIEVADASQIKKGDWVIVQLKDNDPEFVAQDIHPLPLNPKWRTIIEEGVQVNERHKVASVSGNTVTFVDPIHYSISERQNWKLYTFPHLSHVGFENLSFEGNWKKEFVHHRSAQDDGGWSILNLSGLVDSWVKDCRFTNINRAIYFSHSAATTAINVVIDGKIGHSAITVGGGSTGVLLAHIVDEAGMQHASGVGGGSTTGTVIWRSKHPAHTSFESHASQPRSTLFDNVEGGFFKGRAGGAIQNLPNHGRHLVLWNYKETDEAETNFPFVATETYYWRMVPPIIVGFHGAGTTFKEDEVQLIESLGSPVQPESLFEAQLQLRLGKLPQWILDLKNSLAKK
ncbi:DUF4955 domain-containing protein [Zobellia galactanivorans]|uniref:DUF4955 domain-containing protein n=1 Tax=Zobellia galactanivorans (strain DSM 12802 / CCUG 47099 / CIP 106680 / NCIMB 13871 / Dsij) TaxID=63186 RepID=UPI0026E3D8A5|nr:DUF4955 domain-containing protein [Zobellia galactanivorans]MDO6807557.1 DUF4955 domain-containing protein [Zobellia galactanivorans]